ncbi:hypothetical protein CF319_g8515, partial [Tilletia indica]
GDSGIIKTLEQPVYLTHVEGKSVFCPDRPSHPQTIAIDPTEYRFKLTLEYEQVSKATLKSVYTEAIRFLGSPSPRPASLALVKRDTVT